MAMIVARAVVATNVFDTGIIFLRSSMSDGPPPQQPDPAAPVVSRETASPRREAEAKGAVPTPPPPETRQPQPTPTARASPPIQQPPQQRPQQQQQEEQMDTSHPLAATQVSQEMETTFTDDPKTVEPVQNGTSLYSYTSVACGLMKSEILFCTVPKTQSKSEVRPGVKALMFWQKSCFVM